jgi:hypothetical protein
MSLEVGTERRTLLFQAILLVCVVVLALSMAWAFLGMRVVMDVGGSCAEGGPYVIAQPCPDGTVLLSVAIPIMIVTAMLGSAIAAWLRAPTLLLPMWVLLFGSLGWNFLEYGVAGDGTVWGWVVCGVIFELMALPALLWILTGGRLASVLSAGTTEPANRALWYAIYLAVGLVGAGAGWWTFDALS